MELKLFFLGFLFIGFLNAVVVSGGGVSFAKNKSAEMCSDPRVSEVFICTDNSVKVVWAESDKGATFYAPSGKITNCPPAPPGQASAECVRFLMPNYCTSKVECEKKSDEVVVKNETTEENITEKAGEEKPVEEKPTEEKRVEDNVLNNEPVVIPYTNSNQQPKSLGGDTFSSPIIIVFVIMVILLIALYFIFKKTVRPT